MAHIASAISAVIGVIIFFASSWRILLTTNQAEILALNFVESILFSVYDGVQVLFKLGDQRAFVANFDFGFFGYISLDQELALGIYHPEMFASDLNGKWLLYGILVLSVWLFIYGIKFYLEEYKDEFGTIFGLAICGGIALFGFAVIFSERALNEPPEFIDNWFFWAMFGGFALFGSIGVIYCAKGMWGLIKERIS